MCLDGYRNVGSCIDDWGFYSQFNSHYYLSSSKNRQIFIWLLMSMTINAIILKSCLHNVFFGLLSRYL